MQPLSSGRSKINAIAGIMRLLREKIRMFFVEFFVKKIAVSDKYS
jgi:hypothetical protein